MLMEVFSIVLGVCIILLAITDIVLTVLHIQRRSLIEWLFTRSLWSLLRAIASPLPGRARHHVLSWGFPLMIAGLIGIWVCLLVVGYSLIYWPFISNDAYFSQTQYHQGFGGALYFSGVTLATIGYGDIHPRSTLLGFVAVTEGFSGFVVITMSVTFLLSVYPSLLKKSSLASALNREVDGDISAVPMIARYIDAGNLEALYTRIADINKDLLEVIEAHRVHSALYYAHPFEPDRSLVRVLLIIRGIITALRFGLYDQSRKVGQPWNDPRILVLEDSFTYALAMFAESVYVASRQSEYSEEEVREYLRKDYRSLRHRLHDLGLVLSADDGAEEEYVRFRLSVDPYINAYREHSGYTTSEVESKLELAAHPLKK